jgi:bifunctional lysine-specific demethylase and histidyl-hydroxylase NO66
MDFARFIAPFPAERFAAEIYDRAPLHVPAEGDAGAARRGLIGWARLNALLDQRSHWTPGNIRLVMNSRPVDDHHYIEEVATMDGRVRRADPAKVRLFLAMGASLVANAVEDADAAVAEATAMLARRFAGRGGANLYCSFKGVQAFASHCDLHDVFAVQIEGEKGWRIYRDRAPDPLRPIEGPDAQARIDRAKGPVLTEIRMKPGDLLYIPRGFYHDALASSEASLHLTFSVTPYSGLYLLRLLEELAADDPAFRAWLPDVRDEAALGGRLEALGARLSALLASPLLKERLAARQRALAVPPAAADLPARMALSFYARTDRPASVARPPSGALLRHPAGEDRLGTAAAAAEWALAQPAFSTELLKVRHPELDREEAEALVALLLRRGLVFAYTPDL